MKKNVVKTMLSLTLAASMVMGAPASLYAAEEPAAEDTEEAAAEETGEDLKVALTEGELVIKNQTTRVFEKAELVKREAKAEAEAAAAAQAQAQAQQQAPAVYEVSRVAYDDCDGSGHGYFEITYSDGSVAYEEY